MTSFTLAIVRIRGHYGRTHGGSGAMIGLRVQQRRTLAQNYCSHQTVVFEIKRPLNLARLPPSFDGTRKPEVTFVSLPDFTDHRDMTITMTFTNSRRFLAIEHKVVAIKCLFNSLELFILTLTSSVSPGNCIDWRPSFGRTYMLTPGCTTEKTAESIKCIAQKVL